MPRCLIRRRKTGAPIRLLRPVRALAILLLAVPAFSGGSAAASADFALPWPPRADDPPSGERVTFESHSPFALSDVGEGPEDDPKTTAQGMLFVPQGASAANPVPAVILLHGASGVLGQRELTYGRQFAANGVAALAIDVFAARRDMASGFIDRLLNITEAMFLADAYSGLRFLDKRPEIDGGRVALVGFSYGGMVATYAAYAQTAERFARDGERFAAHVAFYAPCIAEFEDSRATGAPLLMLYGERDGIIDPERCHAVAGNLEDGGGEVQIVSYPDAVHQWDGRYGGERPIGRDISDCRFVVERDGAVRDSTLFVPMSSPLLRKAMLGLCSDSKGYLIGRNDDVRAKSNRDMGRFLARALGRGRNGVE